MTRAQPAGDIKVQVPRHNTQPISKKLCAEVEAIAKSDRVQTDIHPSQSPTNELAQAIVSDLYNLCMEYEDTTSFTSTGKCIRLELASYDGSRRAGTSMGHWHPTVRSTLLAHT